MIARKKRRVEPTRFLMTPPQTYSLGSINGILKVNRVSTVEDATSSVPPCAFAISEAM